jgi:hypothetical protein
MQQAIEKQEAVVSEARKSLAAKRGVLDLMERTLMEPMVQAATAVVAIEG